MARFVRACFGRIALGIVVDVSCQVFEEVMPEDAGYAGKHVRVNAVFLEDAVHIGAVAGEFPCKPGDASFLSSEFLLDQLADVFHDVAIVCFSGRVFLPMALALPVGACSWQEVSLSV